MPALFLHIFLTIYLPKLLSFLTKLDNSVYLSGIDKFSLITCGGNLKKIFLILIILMANCALAADRGMNLPYFKPYDDEIRVCFNQTIYYQVKATHPNSEQAKSIRYHLVDGPGEVDPLTGIWQYDYSEGDSRSFYVEIAASIGNGNNCSILTNATSSLFKFSCSSNRS